MHFVLAGSKCFSDTSAFMEIKGNKGISTKTEIIVHDIEGKGGWNDSFIVVRIDVAVAVRVRFNAQTPPVGDIHVFGANEWYINKKLEGQWPWIPRELQKFVDAGRSVFYYN